MEDREPAWLERSGLGFGGQRLNTARKVSEFKLIVPKGR